MTRTYHISLIFLAPFCVIGGITVFGVLSRVLKVSWTNESVRSSLKALSVYFVIFLLFNTGFVYEVGEGHSGSISLNHESIKKYGDAKAKVGFYNSYKPEQDVFGAKWLYNYKNKEDTVIADCIANANVLYAYAMLRKTTPLSPATKDLSGNKLLYLKYLNTNEKKIAANPRTYGKPFLNSTDIPLLSSIEKENKVYTNEICKIYRG